MKAMKVILLSSGLFLITLPSIARAADTIGAQEESQSASAHQFVEDFYDWYVPLALKESDQAAYDNVIKSRPKAFSKALVRGLKQNYAAPGLDIDPFLNAQDPCEKYVLGQTSVDNNNAAVELYAVCSGKKEERPSVIAELVRSEGGWQFANFKYQTDEVQDDLLARLAALKKETFPKRH